MSPGLIGAVSGAAAALTLYGVRAAIAHVQEVRWYRNQAAVLHSTAVAHRAMIKVMTGR